MLLKEIIQQAVFALVTQRFRAGLTMLGIAWGIVTVVLMMAYGNGFQSALQRGFRGAYSDGTVVLFGGQTSLHAGGERAGKPVRLKPDDVEAIQDLGTVKMVSPEYIRTLVLAYGNRQTSVAVRGVAPEYGVMRHEVPEVGRFLNAEDVEKRRRVVFLGDEVARKLFGNAVAVGETVRIAGMAFEVIGVLANKPQMGSYYMPDKYCAFIPHSTVGDLWSNEFLYSLVFQSVDVSLHEQAVRQVKATLGSRHDFDPRDERALYVNDSVENIQVLSGITNGLKAILIFIGSLTLMIGGVGVMNIMLVSVTERTREVGVRKALGARRRHILAQFLMEAIAITFLGGLFGVLLSFGLVAVMGSRPFLADLLEDASRQTDIHFMLSPDVLITATGILVFVGLLSGLWPAWRASRMDPIESLRYE